MRPINGLFAIDGNGTHSKSFDLNYVFLVSSATRRQSGSRFEQADMSDEPGASSNPSQMEIGMNFSFTNRGTVNDSAYESYSHLCVSSIRWWFLFDFFCRIVLSDRKIPVHWTVSKNNRGNKLTDRLLFCI